MTGDKTVAELIDYEISYGIKIGRLPKEFQLTPVARKSLLNAISKNPNDRLVITVSFLKGFSYGAMSLLK